MHQWSIVFIYFYDYKLGVPYMAYSNDYGAVQAILVSLVNAPLRAHFTESCVPLQYEISTFQQQSTSQLHLHLQNTTLPQVQNLDVRQKPTFEARQNLNLARIYDEVFQEPHLTHTT